MWRHVASNAITVLIVALAAAAGLVAWSQARFVAPGPLEQAICLRVEPGSNLRRVSSQLAEQGAIAPLWLFRVGASYSDRADQVKAGSFLISEGASMADVLATVTGRGISTCGTEIVYAIGVRNAEMRVRDLDPATGQYQISARFDPRAEGVEPPPEYAQVRAEADTRYRVSLAEGVTAWNAVEALKAADFLDGTLAEVPPEGMLAPDSYEVAPGSQRAALLERMQAAQEERLARIWADRAENLPVATPEAALTLASLIEKETGVAGERATVASVLENRLRSGMALQIDSAVEYGVTKGQGVLGRGLRRSELDRDTPYNLYTRQGLPPGPIANPGLAALEAAVHPARTDYLYFVADGSGGHVFAATLAEHNANVAKWREIEAGRAPRPDAAAPDPATPDPTAPPATAGD